MLNLLPKDYKEKVRGEYLRRLAIVILIGLTFVDIFFLVAISPAYISASMDKKITEETNSSIKNSPKVKDVDVVLSNMKDLQSRLDTATTIPGERPSDFISKALELKGKGIYIQNILYSKKDAFEKEVILKGTASSRVNLIDFSKRIKSSDWTSSSDIPLSNLASDKNINFIVSLISKKQ
jgi:hypothetical protein